MELSLAQTASDYFMPLCVGNQTVFHTDHNDQGWAGRTVTYSFIQTDLIDGEIYFLEEGIEYLFNELGAPSPFHFVWLRKDLNGEILIKAYAEYPILDSAVIFPTAGTYFSNNYLTAGNSLTQTYGVNQTITDSVISTNATCGIFSNCLQIRETNKTNGIIERIDDNYYAFGVGHVGSYRSYPPDEVHTQEFASAFVTGCDPIVDSLPAHVVDTCLGQYLDYYVNDLQVDTINKTVTLTWVFQVGIITNQFIETYNYQYKGNNVIGITINCDRASVSYYNTINISSSLLSVNEPIAKNTNFVLFPNPASDMITVKTINDINEPLTLNIYNIMGQRVKSELLKQNQQQINIGGLSNGVYIVEIETTKLTGKQKLIIQR